MELRSYDFGQCKAFGPNICSLMLCKFLDAQAIGLDSVGEIGEKSRC